MPWTYWRRCRRPVPPAARYRSTLPSWRAARRPTRIQKAQWRPADRQLCSCYIMPRMLPSRLENCALPSYLKIGNRSSSSRIGSNRQPRLLCCFAILQSWCRTFRICCRGWRRRFPSWRGSLLGNDALLVGSSAWSSPSSGRGTVLPPSTPHSAYTA